MDTYDLLKELNAESLLTIYVMSENKETGIVEISTDPVGHYLNITVKIEEVDDNGQANGIIQSIGCWTDDHLPITTIFVSDFPNWQPGTEVRITFKEPKDENDYMEHGNGFIERFW